MAERIAACPVAHTTGGAILPPRRWTVTPTCGLQVDKYSAVQVLEYVMSAHAVVYDQGTGHRRRGLWFVPSCWPELQVATLSSASLPSTLFVILSLHDSDDMECICMC